MKIAQFLLRRILMSIPLLIGVSLVTFILVRISGQDPAARLAGPMASAAEIDAIRQSLRLDQPILAQFVAYITQLVQGDWGHSWSSNRDVLSELMTRVPATVELIVLGGGIGIFLGVLMGLHAGMKPGSLWDQIVRLFSVLGISIPTYWLGLVSLFVFFYILNWAPPGMGRLSLMLLPPPTVTGSILVDALIAGDMEAFRSAAAQLALPGLCIAFILAAPIAKQTRTIVAEAAATDYVRFARSQGLPPRRIRRIVLKNSLTAVITFIGTELVAFAGTMSLIEFVFAWGGIGQMGLNAIVYGDFSVVQGYVLMLVIYSVIVFTLVDALVSILDPRAAQT